MSNQKKNIIQKIVLGGVVMKGSHVLILQRNQNEDTYPGVWELPSGKRQQLEASMFSLTREIKEETGLDVEVILPVSVFDYQIEKPDEIRDSTQINFLVTPIKGCTDVILSNEHQAFMWIRLDEIDKYEITDDTKNVIRIAFQLADKIMYDKKH